MKTRDCAILLLLLSYLVEFTGKTVKLHFCLAFATIVCGSLSHVARGASHSNTYVLAVGTEHSFDPSLKELKYSTLDTKRFVRAMELVSEVPTKQIKSYSNITLGEFRRIAADTLLTLGNGEKINRFVLYFSGHSDERGLHFTDGLYPKDELHAFLRKIPAATKISIFDSCYSGALAAKGIEPATEEFLIPRTDFDEPTGTVFLTASSADESAFESESLEGSVFSNHLVSGLYGGADLNSDGLVTVEELYQFVYQKTRQDNLMFPAGRKQQPEFVSALKGRGALVLSMPKANLEDVTLDESIDGDVSFYAIYGLKSFALAKTGIGAQTYRLPIGQYRMSVQRGRLIGQTDIKVASTQPVYIRNSDLKWQPVSAVSTAGLKGYERQFEVEGQLGIHSGHLVEESAGPAAQIALIGGHLWTRAADLRAMGSVFLRQNKLESEFGAAREFGSSLMIGGKAVVPSPFSRVEIYGFGLGGVGYLRQSWTYGANDDDVSDASEATYHTYHPIAHLGLGSDYVLANGIKIGAQYRREFIHIVDKYSGAQNLSANIFGATIAY